MVGRSTRRPIRILAIVQEFKVTAMLKKSCVLVSMEIALKLARDLIVELCGYCINASRTVL
jgi:hypothetical protein